MFLLNAIDKSEQQKKTEEAREYLKRNQKILIERFSSLDKYPPSDNPFSIFMAGSPGAGKTEFSKGLIDEGLIQELISFECVGSVVRIDDDDIREIFKEIGYDGTNTDVFKPASILGVEKIYDYATKHRQNLILDTTFSTNYKKAKENIERALSKNRNVGIFYLYLDPIVAWNFTLIRAKKIGRSVPKEFFVESFFRAKDNANRIKEEFKSKVEVTLLERIYDARKNSFRMKVYFNKEKVDNYIKINYTSKSLISKLC